MTEHLLFAFGLFCSGVVICSVGMAFLLAFDWSQRRIARYKALNRCSFGLGKKRGAK